MLADCSEEDIAMQAYRVEVTVQQDGMLTLENLPLQAGEDVEVIIIVHSAVAQPQNAYPLRGLPVTYSNPTEPVAQADWDAAQ
jgi:hypothetical protein